MVAVPNALVVAVLGSLTTMEAAPAPDGETLYQRGHYQEALSAWQINAQAGNPSAAYRLGAAYLDGVVVKQDVALAVRLLRQAVAGGDSRAMFEMATLFETGIGVEKSLDRAVTLYRDAARRGHPQAAHNLATFYEDGIGVEQDLVEAYALYRLAKARGFALPIAHDPIEDLRMRLDAIQISAAEGRFRRYGLPL